MNRTLLKILTKQKSSFVLSFSLLIVGVYSGFIVWYVLDTYIPESILIYLGYIDVITMGIISFIAVYQIPDLLFANEKIGHILSYPIRIDNIIYVLLKKVAVLQFTICIFLHVPGFLFHWNDWKLVAFALLGCLLMSVVLDLIVYTISIGIGIFSPRKYIGYVFLALQFAGPIGILFVILKAMSKVPLLMDYYNFSFLLKLLIVDFIFCIIIICLKPRINKSYMISYRNVQGFSHKQAVVHNQTVRVMNPYFFLEWKRITRNKQLLFFSNVKNIITVVLLTSVITNNLPANVFLVPYQTELILFVSCAAVNTVSSTAYSSDVNKAFYDFLPISKQKMFFGKTIQGFLWGEITILLFWLGVLILGNVSVINGILFLLYGTIMNYACVWLGVLFDYKMPRTANSMNELLHGNLSKFYVLIIMLILTVVEINVWKKYVYHLSLLPFITVCGIILVILEIGYSYFERGDCNDRN